MSNRPAPMSGDPMRSTRYFWDKSPCNGQASLAERKSYRYRSEPWLPEFLRRIGQSHPNVLEIGCGMGTDALTMCCALPAGGKYLGLDYSEISVAAAKQAVFEAERDGWPLRIRPEFLVGNAEDLQIASDSVGCVFSFGALHHTAHPQRAFDEVHRVLRPGGRAYIFLYRKWSPKVSVAKFLRGLQGILDRALKTDQCIYRLFKNNPAEKLLGTAVLECFGVPYMDWFNEQDIRRYFSDFKITALYPIGYSLPWFHADPAARGSLGYYWAIELEK